uniref:Iron-binding zinc finger CDGSH type domain-containing protein n=1 Tax=Hemiselmis andersenii TaxID=464988 RepID=A0A6U2EV27_HEMAN
MRLFSVRGVLRQARPQAWVRAMSSGGADPNEKVVCAGKIPSYQAVEEGKTYFWCSCGRSKTQPFCDGAHKGTAHKPVAYKAEKTGKVKFCMCKSSNTFPLCDASHLRVLIPFIGTSVSKGGEYYRREWEKK